VGTRYDPAWLAPLGQFGHFGVRVFFVVSGYLITSLLVRELELFPLSVADALPEPVLQVRGTSFPSNLVLAFLVALACYKLVEQPFLRLKDRFP